MEFDHILLIGHGGPRHEDEVRPYLAAMTAGKKVSGEQLETIAAHYREIGGASPYYEQVSDFAKRLEESLRAASMPLAVFTGMKNWHPFLVETLAEIYQKGHRNGLGIFLTPYRSVAKSAYYQESLEQAKSSLKVPGLDYVFCDSWYHYKLFVETQADSISRTFRVIPPEERNETFILFSFHSLPAESNVCAFSGEYEREAQDACALVAGALGHTKWGMAYQSRPAGAKGSWLGPDIREVVKEAAGRRVTKLLVVPLGFLCDHMEILYDLDVRLRADVEQSGMNYLRAETVLNHPKTVSLFDELIRVKMLSSV